MSESAKGRAFILATTGLFALWAVTVAPSLRPDLGVGSLGSVLGLNPVGAYMFLWAGGLWAGGLAALLVLRARHAVSWRALGALVLGAGGFLVGLKLHARLETLPVAEAVRLPLGSLFAPGARMPLGLLLGAAVALAVAAGTGAGWRQVGDAWAVATSVMIPLGRVGCMLAGCCFGQVCARWPHALCVTYPPGTVPHDHQVAHGVLQAGSAASLPLHPLPLYFAVASVVTLGVLLWELRRDVAPGIMLATFCVLRPTAKLVLEPLRAEAVPGMLMVAIPATVLVMGVVVLSVAAIRRVVGPGGSVAPAPTAARSPRYR